MSFWFQPDNSSENLEMTHQWEYVLSAQYVCPTFTQFNYKKNRKKCLHFHSTKKNFAYAAAVDSAFSCAMQTLMLSCSWNKKQWREETHIVVQLPVAETSKQCLTEVSYVTSYLTPSDLQSSHQGETQVLQSTSKSHVDNSKKMTLYVWRGLLKK